MKKYSFLFLISILFLIKAYTQEKTVDAVISKAFTAIKNNDEQAFMKLFPTYPQLKNLFSELASQITDSSTRKDFGEQTALLTEDRYNTDVKGKTIQTFQKVVAQGREMGMDWSRASMDSFQAVEQREPGFDVKAMMGNVYFSENGKQFYIPFSEVIWSKQYQGWFGFGMNFVLKKGEPNPDELNSNDYEMELDTSMVIADTDIGNPTVSSEVKKQSDKKPVNKKPVTKKPEAKQPAKKPSTTTKPKSKS